jgi:phosphate:Na+ symporter
MHTFLMFLGIIASVALFLFSAISFSRVIKKSVGVELKKAIENLTLTPLRGLFVGGITTAILQSSTAASVLVAGLVDAGVIKYFASLGLIFGVNIGTTITSQLIALNFMRISPFIILFGIILYFWGNGLKKYAKPIIFFGMLFLSILSISYFVSEIDQVLLISIVSLASNVYSSIIFGMLLAIFLQSSSVVSGLVLVMAGGGLLSLSQATGMVLGANIGTTSTVIIASIAMNKYAKRVAAAHFFFNLIGVLLALPILHVLYGMVESLGGSLQQQVANIQLIFNVSCALLFLVFVKPYSKFISWLVRSLSSSKDN